LRIAVKKLHYGTDFFASLFPKRRRQRERYLDLLKALQDQLGQLNDIHTHEAIAREVVQASRGRSGQGGAEFGMGLILGLEQGRAQTLDAAARKTAKKLARASAFWT
jgi:CHAD domain-containing protein